MQTSKLNYLSSVIGPNMLAGRGSFPDQENFWPKLSTKPNSSISSFKASDTGSSLRNGTAMSNQNQNATVAAELDATKAVLKSTENVADVFLKATIVRNQQDEKILKSLNTQINLLASAKSMHENELRELRKSRADIHRELEESRKKLAELTGTKDKLEQTLMRTDYLLDSKICAISSLSGQLTHLGQLLSEQHQGMLQVKSCLSTLDPSGSAPANAARRAGLFVRGNVNIQPHPSQQVRIPTPGAQTRQQENPKFNSTFGRPPHISPSRISLLDVCMDQTSESSMKSKMDDKNDVSSAREIRADSKDAPCDDSVDVDLQQPEKEIGDVEVQETVEVVDNTEDFRWLRDSLRQTLICKAGGSGLRLGQVINASEISPALRQALHRVNDYTSSALAGHEHGRSITANFIQDIKLLCKQWPDLDVFCAIFESQAK